MLGLIRKVFGKLNIRQQIAIAVVLIATLGGILWLVEWKKNADYRPLFTGLAPEDAAGIVQKLKEAGADYRLKENGGAVLVPSARLDELRLTMASAGLPKTGRIGFELFDKTNLGTTEFTEHVNYRRALEGELERTVMSLAEVDQARVHLTFPKESVFLEAQQPAKASVLVRIKTGAKLAPQNVKAITHLMANAVEGLTPDSVSVLDMNGNLLSRPKLDISTDNNTLSADALEYRRQVEADLLAKVNATLGPTLGPNRYRAGVSVECDFSGGDLSEEVFDPAHSVMTNSQRSEDSVGSATSSGVPGTASSLPRPTSKPGSGNSRTTRLSENIAYQTSRAIKKTHTPPGVLRRISVAVLVDQDVNWERDKNSFKRVLIPPTPEKLKVIRDLVAGVTGFSADRGDQVVIDTLPFESTLQLEPPPLPGAPGAPGTLGAPQGVSGKFVLPPLDKKIMMIGGGALGALVLLMVAFMAMRRKTRPVSRTTATSAGTLPEPVSAPMSTALPPPIPMETQLEEQLAEREALQAQMEAQALSSLRLAPVITKKAEVFAKHLREKISKEPDISVQILRSWIREEEL